MLWSEHFLLWLRNYLQLLYTDGSFRYLCLIADSWICLICTYETSCLIWVSSWASYWISYMTSIESLKYTQSLIWTWNARKWDITETICGWILNNVFFLLWVDFHKRFRNFHCTCVLWINHCQRHNKPWLLRQVALDITAVSLFVNRKLYSSYSSVMYFTPPTNSSYSSPTTLSRFSPTAPTRFPLMLPCRVPPENPKNTKNP